MPAGVSAHAHSATPTLAVSDARGLSVRAVGYHRRKANDPIDTRVTQQRYDAVGRLIASRDPYLFDLAQTNGAAPFNLNQVLTLSATALLTESVDAGWRLGLSGEAGQSLETWDGRGSRRRVEHDELLRPVALREAGTGIAEQVIERFTYADAGPETAAHNLCGQLVRHDDPAGTVVVQEAGLSGLLLRHTRRFLTGTEAPDWPLATADRDSLLEPDDGMNTANTYAASGEALSQTDAMGNIQSIHYTRAGQLKDTRLTLAGTGQNEKLLVSDLRYNAMGQIEAETAGNGVITRHRYDEANGQLIELSAHKASGTPLQHLKYQYDAIGNVLSIEDSAQPVRYHSNQLIEPIRHLRYDTLGQLIEATGCEAKTSNGGPALPDLQPLVPDPSQIALYTQTYHYDADGNLLNLLHSGSQAQGRTLTKARYSNRCLPERDGRPPTEAELAKGFDSNGNLLELQPGQGLSWDLRNQLREVHPVVRDNAANDSEAYVYDGAGERVRKVQSSQASGRTIVRDVRYLPGLEIRSHGGTREVLNVITTSAGSNSVQVLHWASEPPDSELQDQIRYSLDDQVKSSTLELDQQADVISWEWYYPFGGTARWAGRDVLEAGYKTRRYSGKERDATGLYYYGLRYYAPWLQRWVNPDPAGAVDGLNFYRMVRNNPVALYDPNGASPEGRLSRQMMAREGFLESYAANPVQAINELRQHYKTQRPDIEDSLRRAAIRRVREAMTPMETPPEALPMKNIPKPIQEYSLKTFNTIYGTNEGSREINQAMRQDTYIDVRGDRVVGQIRKALGYEILKEDEALSLKISANGFNRVNAEQVSYQLYQQSNTVISTYYRGQDLTEEALDEFIAAMENKTILHSKSFLSVDPEITVAEKFMGGEIPVLFIVSGFSASVIHNSYSSSDEKDRVFSPHADFEVTAIGRRARNRNEYGIRLREVRAHTGPRTPLPY